MNPTDLTDALLHGIPIVLYASMYHSFNSVLARRQPLAAGGGGNGSQPTRGAGDSALHITIARSAEQREAVRDLVRKRYAWRGYRVEALTAVQTPEQDFGPQEVTFLVASRTSPVGTLTLGLDGPLGLRAEEEYGDVIAQFRASGKKVCELTRLALSEAVNSKGVLALLFSLAHAVGRTTHGVTDVFIEVNPRHVDFYMRVLGFVVAAGEKLCERVRAPSVLLRLEIEALEERLGITDFAALQRPLIGEAA